MWKLIPGFAALLLCTAAVVVVSQEGSKWLTLTGDAPLVIARGGFSGSFPDSSFYAYSEAGVTSLPNLISWCDVQLTKDRVGICFPDVLLDNASYVSSLSSNQSKSYLVNGVSKTGFFTLDFTIKGLQFIPLMQPNGNRPVKFNSIGQPILTVETLSKEVKPPGLWLNVQHDSFYSQHGLSMRDYVISVSTRVAVNYISSPEVMFLTSIVAPFRRSKTKLVFRFLEQESIEPSTNQTYGSLLRNLTFIKTFASGILVPKSYIWPVDSDLYLKPHRSVVLDSHKEGLQVFASGFANDVQFAYNYSYDPVVEYLSFIDNGVFSVDGVLSDFPITPSAAIDCYSHMGPNDSQTARLLVISNQGASGDYPGCSDLAYANAISDGADVIDCPVQLTKDGTPFCLGSINLLDGTNVAQTEYSNQLTTIPELKTENGIYAFNLSWSEIMNKLKPAIAKPYADLSLYRNPKFSNSGSFVALSQFLALAKNATSLSGALIRIEYAAYLAEKQGLGVVAAVMDSLSKAGYNNQTMKKVMIQSTDSSVLEKFNQTGYELVYHMDKPIGDITDSTISEIKSFASSVVTRKTNILPTSESYTIRLTDVVPKLQASGLQVYVSTLTNEYVTQAWDFFCDARVEINTFVKEAGINGVVTSFPATANKYRRNRCLGYKEIPSYMKPVPIGGLLEFMAPVAFPPALAPSPTLSAEDVDEPPLPAVAEKTSPPVSGGIAPSLSAPSPPSGQAGAIAASILLSSLAVVLSTLMLSHQ